MADLSSSSLFIRAASLACALLLMVAIVAGYLHLRGRHAQRVQALQQFMRPAPQPTNAPPQLRVIENQPTLRGSTAVLNGIVQNVSDVEVANLSIEFELIPRRQPTTQALERRLLTIVPAKLSPSEAGKYQMEISSRRYSGARVARVVSGDDSSQDVPFEVQAGRPRPKELPIGPDKPPPQTTKRPSDNNGFLNSPDNPVGLP